MVHALLLIFVVATIAALAVSRRRLSCALKSAQEKILAEAKARQTTATRLTAAEIARAEQEQLIERTEADATRARAEAAHADEVRLREHAVAQGALAAAQEAERSARGEADRIATTLASLRQEIARIDDELAKALEREAAALASLRTLDARIAAQDAAHEQQRGALERALAGARGDAERAEEHARQARTAAEEAQGRLRGAAESQRLMEEEARLARTAKASYVGEIRLLREELARATAKRGAANVLSPKEPPPPPPVHVTAWTCTICGTTAAKAVKDCCLKAGLSEPAAQGSFRDAVGPAMLARELGGRR